MPLMKVALLFVTLTFQLALTGGAAEQGTLDPHLEPLRPWLGKTWKSEAAESGGKAKIDVARWERALNGKAVRILHSINDGEYAARQSSPGTRRSSRSSIITSRQPASARPAQ